MCSGSYMSQLQIPFTRCALTDTVRVQFHCAELEASMYRHRNYQICPLVHYCVFLCTFKLIQHMAATRKEAKFPLWVQFIYTVSHENCILLYFVNNFAKCWPICIYSSEKMACNFQQHIRPQQSTFTDAGYQDTILLYLQMSDNCYPAPESVLIPYGLTIMNWDIEPWLCSLHSSGSDNTRLFLFLRLREMESAVYLHDACFTCKAVGCSCCPALVQQGSRTLKVHL